MGKSDDERAKRLAEALRANLRRRKAQARGDEPVSAEVEPDGGGDPHASVVMGPGASPG